VVYLSSLIRGERKGRGFLFPHRMGKKKEQRLCFVNVKGKGRGVKGGGGFLPCPPASGEKDEKTYLVGDIPRKWKG